METDRQKEKQAIRLLVRAREDFQRMRKTLDNRIGRKASGDAQNIDERDLRIEDIHSFQSYAEVARSQEQEIEKHLLRILKTQPVYTEYLSKVKGVGTLAAAWIISEFDIHIATNISKMWQYGGLNPGLIYGKKRRANKDGSYSYIPTNTLIRGDRCTPGFIAPFNKNLRTRLVGILADGFIKAKSGWAGAYYHMHVPEHYRTDEEKMKKRPELAGQYGRLDVSEKMTTETKKGGKIVSLMWKETTDSHRDRAAKRFMIKEFIKELYVNWRTIEGLQVRPPYQEEYLSHVHGKENVSSEQPEMQIAV